MSEPSVHLFVIRQPKFPLGALVATPNALAALAEEDIHTALNRHILGDWGELDAEDRQANTQALTDGSRLLSAYISKKDRIKFYVITEADRSVTTILLPSEY